MIKNMKMKTALTIVISFFSILCLSFLYVTTQSGMTRLMKTSAKEKMKTSLNSHPISVGRRQHGFQALWPYASLTQCRPRRPYLCGKALDPDVLYALHSLYRCRCTGADSSISRALLHLILAHVLPELSLEPAPEPKAMDLTSSVVRYIMRNFRQPLSLEHIAKELGVSKYHLSHVFSARLHTSFREYVNALRLDCARDLLAATELSMLEVSMESGFDSLRTFNRVFQERFRQCRIYAPAERCE